MRTLATHSSMSPKRTARLAGALWLICILTSMFSYALDSRLIVYRDAAATAANIAAHETQYRVAFLAVLCSAAAYVGVTALMFNLLKSVGRNGSLAAALFGVTGIAVGSAGWLAHAAPMVLLPGDASLATLPASQLQAISLAALKLQMPAFSIAMIFFGMQVGLLGILIARSGFLPRALGALLSAGGCAYIISSCASLVAPSLGSQLVPFVVPIALLGEGSVTVWLLVGGVNEQRWPQQAEIGGTFARQLTQA
jgi:hypothetical protein